MVKTKINESPSVQANRTYKDTLFRFLFGNPDHKEWTLSLFNAVSGTDHTDAEAVVFRQSENICFIQLKEDIVFLYKNTLAFFEHQSTWTPNMPIRMLEYAASQIAKIVRAAKGAVYHSAPIPLPRPKFFVLYNGKDHELPEETTLWLSHNYDTNNHEDEFGISYDIKAIVHVINISAGSHNGVQKTCRPLEEYVWMVSAVRKYGEEGMPLSQAINRMMDSIPEDFVTRDFILAERRRVITMMFDEMGDKEQIQFWLEAVGNEKYKEGKADVIRAMLRKGYKDSEILELTNVTPECLASLKENVQQEVDKHAV